MDPAIFAALGAGGLTLVSFVLYAWRSDARRTRRVLRRARVVRIADLVDGQLACVVGVAEPDGAPIESVVLQRPCIAFDTTIQVFRDNDFTIPLRVDVTRRMVPFFITDETGRVRIDAAEAALCNRPIGRNARYEERVIEPGARVRLVGSVRLEPVIARSPRAGAAAPRGPAGELGFRDGALTATLTGTAKYPLLVDLEDE